MSGLQHRHPHVTAPPMRSVVPPLLTVGELA